jgi:hypothetical protein
MRSHGSKLSLVALLVVVGSAAVARADEDGAKPASEFPWFAGFGAGMGYPTIEGSQQIASGSALAPAFTLHAGRTLGERFTLGLELATVQMNVGRDQPDEVFRVGYTPQQKCRPDCPPNPGAELIFTPLVFSTLGARAEYAPFSRVGLFVGGTAGLGLLVGLGGESGFGFGARVGYRIRVTNMAFVIEAGMQGQFYEDTTMYMPYGAAVLRPYF